MAEGCLKPEKENEKKEKKQKKEEIEKENITSSDNTYISINRVLSSDVCAEPEKPASAPAEPPIITFLLNDGSEYPITQKIFDQLSNSYPAVDTMQTLREIQAWCFANPKNRKTRNGALRFINSWFSREQNRGFGARAPAKQHRLTAEEVYNLPAIIPWSETGG